jgi:hypothetical protein
MGSSFTMIRDAIVCAAHVTVKAAAGPDNIARAIDPNL